MPGAGAWARGFAGTMVDNLFWLSLIAKMAVAALIVVTASKVAERADPFLAGMLVTLPVSAGPAYVFLAIDQGARFVEASTLVSLCANAATGIFTGVYALLAGRRGTAFSLLVALAVWFAVVWVLIQRAWTMPEGLALNVAAFTLSILATRHLAREAKPRPAPVRKWWDIPFRACLVMVLVGIVLLSGQWFGPTVAGVFAFLPIVLISMILILHPRMGGEASAEVMRKAIPGMYGVGAAISVLHALVVPLGIATALSLALATSVAWNAGLILVRLKR